jgi:hypothetical protein
MEDENRREKACNTSEQAENREKQPTPIIIWEIPDHFTLLDVYFMFSWPHSFVLRDAN